MTVEKNETTKRFELTADGHTAYIDYSEDGECVDLIHTEVPDELEGRGIGAELVKGALAYAREHHLRVGPTCSFVRSYIERHPEEQDLVKE